MILTRSPLRISLGGGGTDLRSYYENFEGYLIAAAINKYVYVSITKPFTKGIYLKYSNLEKVELASQIKHNIMRETLNLDNLNTNQIEITTLADIPSGTGLGSSGSFTTALIKGLYQYKNEFIHPKELAELSCHIEIEKLHEPIGKQDQYIAVYGGLSEFSFAKDGTVTVSNLPLKQETLNDLEDNLLLFFTGYSRDAGTILKNQDEKSKGHEVEMTNNLHYVKELGYKSRECLVSGNLIGFAELMREHWEYKKQRSGNMTNKQIDRWHNIALQNGALGGKLVGAGGGGFLMFYAENKAILRKAMTDCGLTEVRFDFDFEGTKTVISS